MKRRDFIMKSAAIGLTAPFFTQPELFAKEIFQGRLKKEEPVCAFSKTFQWLNYDELAGFLADAGFDGIDLSVRPEGHVLPENVERDLPAAVNAARKYGLTIPMITTAITNAADPATVRILKTAADVGVKYYRLGYYTYDNRLTVQQNLEAVRKQLTALCELNVRYGLHGGYQNHVGVNVGSPVWDLWYLIKDLDPRHIGCQYDVRHAVAEGLASWVLGFKAVSTHIKHVCIKDYSYFQNNQGKWEARSVPLGTGVVDFKKYFNLRREYGITGPLSIHYEFPFDGDDVSLSASERIKKIAPAVRREVDVLHKLMNVEG